MKEKQKLLTERAAFRIDKNSLANLKQLASAENCSYGNLIRRIVFDYLKKTQLEKMT